MIDTLTDAGFSVQRCCEVLEVSSQGYYAYQRRPLSPTKMRREWLTALIREVHADSRGTYGARRVHAGTHQRSWDPCQLESGDAPHAQRRCCWTSRPGEGPAHQGRPTRTISSIGSSPAPGSTSCGSPTSPSTAREKARSTAARSWTPAAAASWAGRSTPSKTRSSSSTRSTWPSANAPSARLDRPRRPRRPVHLLGLHRQGPPSRTHALVRLVGDAFDNAMMESFWSTMQIELLDRNAGRPASSSPTRSSSSSRSSTTGADGTPSSTTSHPSSSNAHALTDRLTQQREPETKRGAGHTINQSRGRPDGSTGRRLPQPTRSDDGRPATTVPASVPWTGRVLLRRVVGRTGLIDQGWCRSPSATGEVVSCVDRTATVLEVSPRRHSSRSC